MIYTRTQLDETKRTAERAGWQTNMSGDGKGAEYVNFWKVDAAGNGKRCIVTLAPWLVDELREVAQTEQAEQAGWYKLHAQYYGPGPLCKATVYQIDNGSWMSMLEREVLTTATEQQALDWASAKLGVEAPRVSPIHDQVVNAKTVSRNLDAFVHGNDPGLTVGELTRQARDAIDALLDEVEAPRVEELPFKFRLKTVTELGAELADAQVALKRCAAGPWKAWPENKPEGGRVYLVKVLQQGWRIACHVDCIAGNGTDRWTDMDCRPVRNVTHFAELNTEAT